jgi:hypothetical protein
MARYCRCGKPAVHMIENTGRWICTENLMECPWWKKALEQSAEEMKKGKSEKENKG